MNVKKILKKLLLGLLIMIGLILIVLVINNQIYAIHYEKISTDEEQLSQKELSLAVQVYNYLEKSGNDIFPGFDGSKMDLILFNDIYEFLISTSDEGTPWINLGKNEVLKKDIYRKKADNPQAFAVYVTNRWVGSMSTLNFYNKSITEQIGNILPPQLFSMDEKHYIGTVIHEMTHAYQGSRNDERLRASSKMSEICADFYDDNRFQELIVREGNYLEKAINSTNKEDVIINAKAFLEARRLRRQECSMTEDEIFQEKEFEWLEGLARYAEYKASIGTKSLVGRNLDRIESKVRNKNDDRYYTLGMAEALVLDRLQMNWKDCAFDTDFILEDKVGEAVGNLK